MGMFSKFWNTNASPEGWLGRFALRMMNLTHTPMAQWDLSFIDFQPDWTILDVGCGGGKNIARMLKRCPQGQVYGIDYSEESVAMSRKKNSSLLGSRCFIEQGNVMELPYEDGKFNLVTAVETVYFWPNLPNCLQEVRRVLKSGGKFAILVEVVDSDSKWTSVVEGTTAYSPEDLKKLLDEAGFTQTEIHLKKPTYATILGVKP